MVRLIQLDQLTNVDELHILLVQNEHAQVQDNV
jgi:hypothetical protein